MNFRRLLEPDFCGIGHIDWLFVTNFVILHPSGLGIIETFDWAASLIGVRRSGGRADIFDSRYSSALT